jgi:NTE family protein
MTVESLDARAEALREAPVFSHLPQTAIRELAGRAVWVEEAAGDWLFREGDACDGLYVLGAGRLEVVREAGDAEVVMRSLRPGAVLGELAILTGSKRSASVRARRDCVLLKLSSDAFLELVEQDSRFAADLTRTLATQLQASRAVSLPRDPVPPVIALVPLSEQSDLTGVAEALAAELGRWGRVKLLREAEATEEGNLGGALDRWERASDQVLLTAESVRPEDDWSAFCLRQADRIVAASDGSAPPGNLDRHLLGSDLAMLGWPESRPALSGLVDGLDSRAVHLVRAGPDRAESIEAMARRLAGRSVGVVLSGGGARGLAHIGVLEVLLATGVKIDRVGGCSMGALVGALFARGLDPDEIEQRLHEELVTRKPMSDYTLPLAALLRGRKAEAMLLRLFADLQVEELPREFFCVSSDLVSSELIVHRRGALYEAVGASLCLPGIAPPVASGERLLVDGGVLDNLPVQTMAARGEGPVIAVDVSSRFEPPARRAGGAGRPRLRDLSARVRRAVIGWDAPLPSFRETITRTVVLGSIDSAEAARRHAQIVIAPEVQGIGLTEFRRITEIRAQGAAAARAVLERLPEGPLRDAVPGDG